MQLPFWSSLTERERETVQRSAVTRRYEKGALIHDGGSECLGLVLVLSGELRTYLLSDEGREVTLFRLYAGDLCVLSASCVISQILQKRKLHQPILHISGSRDGRSHARRRCGRPHRGRGHDDHSGHWDRMQARLPAGRSPQRPPRR